MSERRYHDLCRAVVVRALESGELVVDDDLLFGTVFWEVEGVFRLEWDSGSPGAGAGVEQVVRVGDLYLSRPEDWEVGVFDTLEEAVQALTGEEGICVTTATVSIDCTEWSDEEIIRRIVVLGEAPDRLRINGRVWPYETLEHVHGRLGGRGW